MSSISNARRVVVAAIFAALALSAVAAEHQRRLLYGGDIYTLHGFSTITADYNYFGRYSYALELTGGRQLMLFPNGRFVITAWCDVCPERVLALGSFAVAGERLNLAFSDMRKGSEALPTDFSDLRVVEGNIEIPGGVRGQEVFIFKSTDIDRLRDRATDAHFKFMVRGSAYPDWQRIFDGFSKELSGHKS